MRIQCPDCGTMNRYGEFFCDECAYDLSKSPKQPRNDDTIVAKQVNRESLSQLSHGLQQMMSRNTVRLNRSSAPQAPADNPALLIYVRGAKKPIVLPPGKKVMLGRKAPESKRQPDIDLTPVGAVERGVSRNHAVIDNSSGTPTITDIGSSNGVHINGARLQTGTTQILSHGDHVYLGRLATFIQFRRVAASRAQ